MAVMSISIIGCGVTNNTNANNKDNQSQNSVNNNEKNSKYEMTTYENLKYGYALKYPKLFSKEVIKDIGNGKTITTEDGNAQLTFMGRNNDLNETLKDNYDKALKQTQNVIDSKLNDKSYVVISQEADYIICFFEAVGSKSINQFELIYRAQDKDKYSDIQSLIHDSFKPGDLEKTH